MAEAISLKICFCFGAKQAAKRKKKATTKTCFKMYAMTWEKDTNTNTRYEEFLLYTLTQEEHFYLVSYYR